MMYLIAGVVTFAIGCLFGAGLVLAGEKIAEEG